MGRKGARRKRKKHPSKPAAQQNDAEAAQSHQSAQLKNQPTLQSKAQSKSASKGRTTPQSKGRLVITHSTYIPGLIPLLEKLANFPEIQTITPAVISRVKSNAPQFRLKVSVPITGGYKLIARQRKSAQEVFVITRWSKEELEQAINRLLGKGTG